MTIPQIIFRLLEIAFALYLARKTREWVQKWRLARKVNPQKRTELPKEVKHIPLFSQLKRQVDPDKVIHKQKCTPLKLGKETKLDHLWNKIRGTLDSRLTNWRDRILQGGQLSAIDAREQGHQFSDNEVFEGIVKAVLSNSTDWSRIERILSDLQDLFHGFDLSYYSTLDSNDISNVFIPWFQRRKAGSMTMKRSLVDLIETANKLGEHSKRYGSLNQYLASLLEITGNNAIYLVKAIGSPRSKDKLPALGIPIAAEAMKNIGYDVAKPDRHINRAMGSFKLVQFSNWSDRSVRKAPLANEKELITVMLEATRFAIDVGVRISFLDNTIWLLFAKSGLYFSNNALGELIRE
jgi:thermostable 8-oxoguanine DNA glycosylase